jgi:hypothetical protein
VVLVAARDVAEETSLETAADSPDPDVDWLDRLLVVSFAVDVDWLVDLTLPVAPVGPELPVMATGFDEAVDVAGPVLPVLVAVDWELTAPEFPDWATGVSTTVGDPAEPPLELPEPVESPPALVAAAAAGPSRATAAAATPVRPARQSPPATRDLYTLVMVVCSSPVSVVLDGARPSGRGSPRTGRT